MVSATLCEKYGITEVSLRQRREFIKLTERDIRTLAKLDGWLQSAAKTIITKLYDHQFAFGQTSEFFQRHAKERGTDLKTLRDTLEGAQTAFLLRITNEAAKGGEFGTTYFEERLRVGRVHNLINLPPRLYFGTYTVMQDLLFAAVRKRYWYSPRFQRAAERAFQTVFNLDAQAVMDSFVLDMMESAGFELQGFQIAPGRDLTDYIGDIKEKFSRDISGLAQSMRDGDLTVAITPTSEKDLVRSGLAAILQSLRDMVRELKGCAAELHVAVEDITTTNRDLAQASAQTATTSQELAHGSEQQAHAATEAAGSMSQLSESIRKVEATAKQLSAAAEQADSSTVRAGQAVASLAESAMRMSEAVSAARSASAEGGVAVDEAVGSMNRIRSQMEISAERVRELGERGREIGAIVETIEQIAEQTNLLALNAAIEAARAGEHGKGFAVVADEVRKLAERSAHSTREISELIHRVRNGVELAVEAMEASTTEVQEGASRSAQAGSALKSIQSAAQKVGEETEALAQITGSLEKAAEEIRAATTTVRTASIENTSEAAVMASGAERVSGAIDTVAAVTQESAAGAEEMSAGARQVAASAASVSATAERLSMLEQALNTLVAKYRMDEEETAQNRPKLRLAA
jgi:methyl-accepting chemotaxis protein